jgi:DNA polymerase III epsilon subunit-like protein
LEWNRGEDKQLLKEFLEILNEADEIVGQNSDNFDVKWLRTRCLKHKLGMLPEYNQVDTYKLAKKYFRFNSNKLDYIASFLENYILVNQIFLKKLTKKYYEIYRFRSIM